MSPVGVLVVVVVSAGDVVVVVVSAGVAELAMPPSVVVVVVAAAAGGPLAVAATDTGVGSGTEAEKDTDSELTTAVGVASMTPPPAAKVMTSLATTSTTALAAVEETSPAVAKVAPDLGAAREGCSSTSSDTAVSVTGESATPRPAELHASPDDARRPSSEDVGVAPTAGTVLDGRMSREGSRRDEEDL